MAETPADVRRDIELTRNRISDTLQELEHKMNVTQIVKDNPWPALALAVGAGVLLSGSKADMKAGARAAGGTRGRDRSPGRGGRGSGVKRAIGGVSRTTIGGVASRPTQMASSFGTDGSAESSTTTIP